MMYLKIGIIVLISLLLLIPTAMIDSLIRERESKQSEAIAEVSNKWGNQQTIKGPMIAIPYVSKEGNVMVNKFVYIMPNELKINGKIEPSKKHRGIYEIVVYGSEIDFSGSFSNINFSEINIDPKVLQFNKAELIIGIDDLRGIDETVILNWNKNKITFNPGITSKDIVNEGIHANIDLTTDMSYQFDIKLKLKGSQNLYFTPVGKTTDIVMKSNWTNPSFNGSYLPDKSIINANGFTANWTILHLNRNFPQMWLNNQFNIDESSFGIDLILPVDNYQKSTRAIKYAILFIGLTFLVFVFIELINKVYIHPFQYILVGIGLVIFYTLLLSISEHALFNIAFIISAIATLLLIGIYSHTFLKSKQLTFFLVSLLSILYLFNFVIIQLQDYSLLIGSIGLFIILAFVMYFSRKIDWQNIKTSIQ